MDFEAQIAPKGDDRFFRGSNCTGSVLCPCEDEQSRMDNWTAKAYDDVSNLFLRGRCALTDEVLVTSTVIAALFYCCESSTLM